MPLMRRMSCGRGIAFDDIVALLHIIALAHADMLALGDQILARLQLVVLGLHDDAALVLVVLAELDEAVGLGQHGRFLGLARLEQLRHARQTARDVAGLGAFGRNTRQHVAGMHCPNRLPPREWRRREIA